MVEDKIAMLLKIDSQFVCEVKKTFAKKNKKKRITTQKT